MGRKRRKGYLNTYRPLNRSNAPRILTLFDICFKQGVIDAYEFSDDYGAKEFLDKHRSAWDFAVLGDSLAYDWEMYRFHLYRIARLNRLTMLSEVYIYRITKMNYLWYLLPFCMQFYLMGIEEWLEYPNPANLELFKNQKGMHWKPMKNRVSRKINKGDYIAYMQDIAFSYRRVPEEKRKMKPRMFDEYCKAIFTLTRPYVDVDEIRIEEDEEEDLQA